MPSSESSGVSKRKPFSKPRILADGKLDEAPTKKNKRVLRLGSRNTRYKLRSDDDIVTAKETKRSKSLSDDSTRKPVRKQRPITDERLAETSKQDEKKRFIRSSPRLTSNKRWNDDLVSSREARTSNSNVPETKKKLSRKPKPLSDENPEETPMKRKKHLQSRPDSHDIPSKRSKDDAVASVMAKSSRKQKTVADEEPEETPRRKKKKRVIRLDPYDTSNKRIDDGIVIPELPKPKAKESKPDELSKNAQFRAINPSQSILKFVESNLLGRRRPTELQKAGYNIDLSAPLDNVPFSTSEERERIEDNIFRNKLNFFAAAKVASSFPAPNLPEIAFAGRSNVGKSSLLNSLTRQWGVARTSDKPGLTQTINFFELGSKLCLVDLPGYGFAYAKDEVKDAWEELVKEYVTCRSSLKRVCLLVDTKWGMKARDYELVHLMESFRTSYQIVLTKTDLVFPMDVARRAMQIEENLKANRSLVHPLMMVSSKSGAGVRCLRSLLSKIGRFAKL